MNWTPNEVGNVIFVTGFVIVMIILVWKGLS